MFATSPPHSHRHPPLLLARCSSRGWGIVRFATPAEAQAAIAAMNGAEVSGRAVQVREDKGPSAPAAEGGEYA